MTDTRDAFETWAYEIENFTTRFERLQEMSSLAMMRATWQAATLAEKRQPLDLSDCRIRQGWKQTFSTNNPFCPCNLKSFTKAVNWAVADLNAAHGIKA